MQERKILEADDYRANAPGFPPSLLPTQATAGDSEWFARGIYCWHQGNELRPISCPSHVSVWDHVLLRDYVLGRNTGCG